jgi:short-subunit dehydrogenase
MSGQTALITGASGGIGRDLAFLLAQDGCDVVLVARGEAKLRALAAELESAHEINARVIVADLARPEAPGAIASAVSDLEIDILINNAGYGLRGPFIEPTATASWR